jgi:hypothetical protein
MSNWPLWRYWPARDTPPPWVNNFIAVVAPLRTRLDTSNGNASTSDSVLAAIAPGLTALGYRVESSKAKADKITLPVLFGDEGVPRVQYEVDAFHKDDGIVVEIEAGRGAKSNAGYRDLIRASLLVDAKYFVLGMPLEYRSGKTSVELTRAYAVTREQLDAIYASQRLALPFRGVLLFGY